MFLGVSGIPTRFYDFLRQYFGPLIGSAISAAFIPEHKSGDPVSFLLTSPAQTRKGFLVKQNCALCRKF